MRRSVKAFSKLGSNGQAQRQTVAKKKKAMKKAQNETGTRSFVFLLFFLFIRVIFIMYHTEGLELLVNKR